MAYSIERTRNTNLEDTAIPNLFITDFMPDVPDGDFVKIYIYAYMCCRQSIALTHAELAERLGLEQEKVVACWRYFSGRRLVNLFKTGTGEGHFDVEFADVKGMLYSKEKPKDRKKRPDGAGAGSLADPALAAMFKNIAVICGGPSVDGGDAQRIISWIEEDGATPEIIEFAYKVCREERGEKGAKYIEKIVREWAGKGLRTAGEVRDHRAKTDARSAAHKKLMEALGLRYVVITDAEEKTFNLWMDDYGYTLERLLELAEKTKGVGNKLRYLEGIIRKEREKSGEGGKAAGPSGGMAARNEYYRKLRNKNEDLAAARLEEAYKASPAVKDADDETVRLNAEILGILTSGMADKKSAVSRLYKEAKSAGEARKKALKEAGFAEDYTEVKYDCARCRDSGVLENGSSCDCYAP